MYYICTQSEDRLYLRRKADGNANSEQKSRCHTGKRHLPGDGCGKCGKLSLACLQILCRYCRSQCRHAGGCGTFFVGFHYRYYCHCFFVRISAKPEDEGHDYGHGKYETLATAIIGIFLLFVGFGIFWNGASSIYRFLQGGSLQEPGILALVAALVSIVFKEVLYQYTVFKGRKLNSQAVVANAWHHRSDAFSSIGTAAGIGGAILLGDHWRVLDPVAAVIVSFFIMKVAVQLLIPCVDELLEKSLPAEVEDEILKTILSFPGISSPHHLRTRRIGSYCAIEVHVRMDGSISLEEAHETATAVENKLKRQFGKGTLVSIHVEPVKKSNEATE